TWRFGRGGGRQWRRRWRWGDERVAAATVEAASCNRQQASNQHHQEYAANVLRFRHRVSLFLAHTRERLGFYRLGSEAIHLAARQAIHSTHATTERALLDFLSDTSCGMQTEGQSCSDTNTGIQQR